MGRRAQEVEERGMSRVLAREGQRPLAHPEVKSFLKLQVIWLADDGDHPAPAYIDDGGLAALKERGRSGFRDLIDNQRTCGRRYSANDHPVEMAVGEADGAWLEEIIDDETVPELLRVAPRRILRADDLTYSGI
jgi:hypothetical protein